MGVELLSSLILCVSCSAFHMAKSPYTNQPGIASQLQRAAHSRLSNSLGSLSRHVRSEGAEARFLENCEWDEAGEECVEVEDRHQKWEDTTKSEETVKCKSQRETTKTSQRKERDLSSENELLDEGRNNPNRTKNTHIGYLNHVHTAHILYALSVLVANEDIDEQEEPKLGRKGREDSQLRILYALKQLISEEIEGEESSQDVGNMMRAERMTLEAEESEKQDEGVDQDAGNMTSTEIWAMQGLKDGLNSFFNVSGWQGYVVLSVLVLVVLVLACILAITGVKLYRYCRARRRHAIIEKLTPSPSSALGSVREYPSQSNNLR